MTAVAAAKVSRRMFQDQHRRTRFPRSDCGAQGGIATPDDQDVGRLIQIHHGLNFIMFHWSFTGHPWLIHGSSNGRPPVLPACESIPFVTFSFKVGTEDHAGKYFDANE